MDLLGKIEPFDRVIIPVEPLDRFARKIGKELNVTRERVRQIESSAIKKLKHPKVGRRLKNYIEE